MRCSRGSGGQGADGLWRIVAEAALGADIANTQKMRGILVRGRWLDREFIDDALAKLEERVGE